MKRILFLTFLLVATTQAFGQSTPTSPLDGQWRGKSDGGSCSMVRARRSPPATEYPVSTTIARPPPRTTQTK